MKGHGYSKLSLPRKSGHLSWGGSQLGHSDGSYAAMRSTAALIAGLLPSIKEQVAQAAVGHKLVLLDDMFRPARRPGQYRAPGAWQYRGASRGRKCAR